MISTCKQLYFYAYFTNNWPTPTKPAWVGSILSLNNRLCILIEPTSQQTYRALVITCSTTATATATVTILPNSCH